MPLLFLFVGVPLLELALLLWIGSQTAWYVPLWIVVGTGVCAVGLFRYHGAVTRRRIQQQLNAGKLPADALADAGLLLFAAGLLLTPGVLTDVAGLTLALPWTRRWWKRALGNWVSSRMRFGSLRFGDFQAGQFQWGASAGKDGFPDGDFPSDGGSGGPPSPHDPLIVEGDVTGRRDDD